MVPPHGHCHCCRKYVKPAAADSICEECRPNVQCLTILDLAVAWWKSWTRKPCQQVHMSVVGKYQMSSVPGTLELLDAMGSRWSLTAVHADVREFWRLRKLVNEIHQRRYFEVQRIFEYYERPLTEAELWFLT